MSDEKWAIAPVEISGFSVGAAVFEPHAFMEGWKVTGVSDDNVEARVKEKILAFNSSATQGKKSLKGEVKTTILPSITQFTPELLAKTYKDLK